MRFTQSQDDMQPLQTDGSTRCSRRTFLKTGSAAAAGISLASYSLAAPQTETLAMAGGGKTVISPRSVRRAHEVAALRRRREAGPVQPARQQQVL